MQEVSPRFMVTDISNVERASTASQYTDAQERSDYWRVAMLHGYFKDTRLDFFFPEQQEADRYTRWQIYQPLELLNSLGKKDSYVVDGVQKFRGFGPANPYTDRRSEQEMWRISMTNSVHDRHIDITSPAPQRSGGFRMEGAVMNAQDLFGTLQTMPASVANQLAQLAQQAAEAEQARLAAQAAADQAAAQAAAQEAALQQQLAQQAAQQAQAAANEAARLAAAAAAAKAQAAAAASAAAQAAANASAAAAAAQRNYLLHKTNPLSTDHLYQITHGGATGYYNGALFQQGQFADPSHPFTGQWFGTFIPVINGQAIPWMVGGINVQFIR